MSHLKRRATALGILTSGVMTLGLCATASASVPTEFASVTGTCNHNGELYQRFYGTPLAEEHRDVAARYSVLSGSAWIDDVAVEAGERVWAPTSALAANSSLKVVVRCSGQPSAVAFEAKFFDVPASPVTYAGAGGNSVLPVRVPDQAQYVADLGLSGGAVELGLGDWPYTYLDRTATFASSGTHPLGVLSAGDARRLVVRSLDGPTPQWTVTVRPLPVAISGLAFESPAARPGAVVTANFSTDGHTTIAAVIKDSAGNVVRTLSSGYGVQEGEHSLSWDGRDANGAALSDGTYTLALTSTDPTGAVRHAASAIGLDGTPPAVAMSSPATITPGQAVTGTVSDPSGLASGTAVDDSGYMEAELQPGTLATFALQPYDAWELGAHQLRVTATDTLGNTRTVRLTFEVAKRTTATPATPGGTSAPSCNKSAAQRAVRRSPSASRRIRRIGNGQYFPRR